MGYFFFVWYHYWPWSSQLSAVFANWHNAKEWADSKYAPQQYTIVHHRLLAQEGRAA